MSLNRLSYDTCSYQTTLNQSVAPISYFLDPIKYENCSKCRPELGLVGGTAVSHVAGNMVDLENDLRNANRPNTHCPSYKYIPPSTNFLQGKDYIMDKQFPQIDTTLKHLPPCQFFTYPEVPLTPAMDRFSCGKGQ
jgi:hypothetical protein